MRFRKRCGRVSDACGWRLPGCIAARKRVWRTRGFLERSQRNRGQREADFPWVSETDPAGEGIPSLEDSNWSSDGEETAFPDGVLRGGARAIRWESELEEEDSAQWAQEGGDEPVEEGGDELPEDGGEEPNEEERMNPPKRWGRACRGRR